MRILPFILVLAFSAIAQQPASNENIVPELKSSPLRSLPKGDADDFGIGKITGTIKTTALVLVKPEYPENARQAGIEGMVRVNVTLDESGTVVKAAAVSGDRRLTGAAIDAAMRSKFRPALNESGNAVAIDGVITYPFEIRKVGWSRVAVELYGLQIPTAQTATISVLEKTFDPQWIDEHGMLTCLRKRIESRSIPRVIRPIPSPPGFFNSNSRSSSQTVFVVVPNLLIEQRQIGKDLIAAVQARLAENDLARWQFDLGTDLFQSFYFLSAKLPDFTLRSNSEAAELIRNRRENRPAGVTEDIIKALQELEENLAAEKRTKELDEALRASITRILVVR
ncbi:MAG: energy transducer TonB [Pyrinomonadaceae bacterium]